MTAPPDRLTGVEVAELERLLAAATPGPWDVVPGGPSVTNTGRAIPTHIRRSWRDDIGRRVRDYVAEVYEQLQSPGIDRTNAQLIVALVNAAPALLAAHQALREAERELAEATGYATILSCCLSPRQHVEHRLDALKSRAEQAEREHVEAARRIDRLGQELAAARETANRLNRRAQAAEGIIAKAGLVEGRPQGSPGRSLGRALANYAAAHYERERDEARDYTAMVAQGVAHYPHHAGEPCTRCRAEQAERERDAATEREAALLDKIEALGGETCACSFDKRGDVCSHHSPKLLQSEQRAARLEAALLEAGEAVCSEYCSPSLHGGRHREPCAAITAALTPPPPEGETP